MPKKLKEVAAGIEERSTEVAVVPPKKELVLEGDPEKQLEFASKAAKALMKVVESKPKKVMINGKQYLEYGSWQTLGRFFGATAGVEWTKRIERNGIYQGYEARAIVIHNGVTISSAEASCLTAERNWASRDEFAVKSMAQTRACAKALRNGFGWVAEMAGYASTPLEEMDGVPRDQEESPGVVIRMDEPKTPSVSPKTIIARLLFKLGHDIREIGPDAADEKVLELTKLEMVPSNFGEIALRLEELINMQKP